MALDANRAEKPLRKLRKLLKKIPAVPSADEIHDFRTSSRRIEATLHALSLDSEKNCRQILKQISRLRKRAGKVRDMDVLTDYLASIPRREEEKGCSVQVLEHLGAQRQKHAEKFDALRQQHATELSKRLKKTSRKMEQVLPKHAKGDLRAAANVTALAVKLAADLRQPPRLGRTNLHPYRLKVKELRNLLQMAEHSDRQEFVQSLGQVKDAIGEWHDWQELVQIAQNVLDDRKGSRLLEDLRETTDSKYRRALLLSENMRKKFLRIADSRNKRRPEGIALRPAEAVWLATASLIA
jgi:CHAD domain-containing protein